MAFIFNTWLLFMAIHLSSGKYIGFVDSPVSPGDDSRITLTLMGLFPMGGTSWPAGKHH